MVIIHNEHFSTRSILKDSCKVNSTPKFKKVTLLHLNSPDLILIGGCHKRSGTEFLDVRIYLEANKMCVKHLKCLP